MVILNEVNAEVIKKSLTNWYLICIRILLLQLIITFWAANRRSTLSLPSLQNWQVAVGTARLRLSEFSSVYLFGAVFVHAALFFGFFLDQPLAIVLLRSSSPACVCCGTDWIGLSPPGYVCSTHHLSLRSGFNWSLQERASQTQMLDLYFHVFVFDWSSCWLNLPSHHLPYVGGLTRQCV